MPPLNPEALTWTGLLAQWVQFAQASLALPNDAEGPRWRASVPAVINLQAVTFALADLERLTADERALALDKAELLIEENAATLQSAWREVKLPPTLDEIVRDAKSALVAASRLFSVPHKSD